MLPVDNESHFFRIYVLITLVKVKFYRCKKSCTIPVYEDEVCTAVKDELIEIIPKLQFSIIIIITG